MRKLLIGTIAAATLLSAPVNAQTINGGIGAGLGVGGVANGASQSSGSATTLNGNINGNTTLNADLSRDISAGSGSGFAGDMLINSIPGGSSFAVVGGAGIAGTSITQDLDLGNNGTITSNSYNAGLYGGLTGGNASLDMQVLNFGQSNAVSNLDVSLDVTRNYTVNFAHAEFENEAQFTIGAVAGAGFVAFGTLGFED